MTDRLWAILFIATFAMSGASLMHTLLTHRRVSYDEPGLACAMQWLTAINKSDANTFITLHYPDGSSETKPVLSDTIGPFSKEIKSGETFLVSTLTCSPQSSPDPPKKDG